MAVFLKSQGDNVDGGSAGDHVVQTQALRSVNKQARLWLAVIATSITFSVAGNSHAATLKFRNSVECSNQMLAVSERQLKEINSFSSKAPPAGASARQWCVYGKASIAQSARHINEEIAFKGSVCWDASDDASLARSEERLAESRIENIKDCAKADAQDGRSANGSPKAADGQTPAETTLRTNMETQLQPRPTFRNKKDCGDKFLAMLLRHATSVGNIVAKIPKPGSETGEFCAYLKTLNSQVARNLSEEQAFKGSVCWDAANEQSFAVSGKKLTDNKAREEKICSDARAEGAQPKGPKEETRAAEQEKHKPVELKSQALIWCEGKDQTSLDLQIGGCTTVIQSGGETARSLAAVFYNRGVAYFSKKEIDKAMADYDQSIRLNPALALPYNNRGFIHFEQGQYSRAVQDYDEAIQRDAKFVLAYINRGNAYLRLKKLDRAILDYDQAIKLEPSEGAFRARGNAYHQQSDYARAIQDFDQALKLDPNSSSAFTLRGLSHEQMGNVPLALEDYGRSIKLNPNVQVAFSFRGGLYAEQGKYDLAIEDLDSAIRLNPEYPWLFSMRGGVYGRLKKYDLAIKDYDAALKLDPARAVTYRVRGIAHQQLGRDNLAIQDFTSAIKIEPNNKNGVALRGSAFARTGQLDLAVQDFNRALELGPDDASLLLERSQAKARLGDAAAARIDLDAAKKLDPNIR